MLKLITLEKKGKAILTKLKKGINKNGIEPRVRMYSVTSKNVDAVYDVYLEVSNAYYKKGAKVTDHVGFSTPFDFTVSFKVFKEIIKGRTNVQLTLTDKVLYSKENSKALLLENDEEQYKLERFINLPTSLLTYLAETNKALVNVCKKHVFSETTNLSITPSHVIANIANHYRASSYCMAQKYDTQLEVTFYSKILENLDTSFKGVFFSDDYTYFCNNDSYFACRNADTDFIDTSLDEMFADKNLVPFNFDRGDFEEFIAFAEEQQKDISVQNTGTEMGLSIASSEMSFKLGKSDDSSKVVIPRDALMFALRYGEVKGSIDEKALYTEVKQDGYTIQTVCGSLVV